MFIHTFRNGPHTFSAERRLIYLDYVPGNAENETLNKWKEENKGARELMDHFMNAPQMTEESLQEYMDSKEEITPFDESIQRDLLRISSPALDVSHEKLRNEAEQRLRALIQRIEDRKIIVSQAREKIGAIAEKQEIPSFTNNVLKVGKDVVGACVDGFGNASGTEKAIMVAGTLSAFLMGRAVLSGAGGMFPGTSTAVKRALGLAVGGGLTYMAFESINKTVEKTRGRPLVDGWWTSGTVSFPVPNNELPIGFKSQEEWDERTYAEEIKKMRDDLSKAHMPDALIDQLVPADKQKILKGMVNLSKLNVEQFQKLYEEHQEEGRIPDTEALFPHYPAEDSPDHPERNLTPVERFQLVRDLGIALGLIGADGEWEEQPDDRQNKNILYLALDWQKH